MSTRFPYSQPYHRLSTVEKEFWLRRALADEDSDGDKAGEGPASAHGHHKQVEVRQLGVLDGFGLPSLSELGQSQAK